jgi:Family of unknown function (DUF6056)
VTKVRTGDFGQNSRPRQIFSSPFRSNDDREFLLMRAQPMVLNYLGTMEHANQQRFWIGFVVVFAAFFFLVLLAYAYIGLFIRLIYDDYCTASSLQTHGFLGAQKYWYTTWSGRFAFTLAITVAHLIGPKVVPYLPAFALSLWLSVMTWTLLQLRWIVPWPHPIISSFFIAELVIVATLMNTPVIFESFYWETGILTYIAPLIIMTAYVGILLRRGASVHGGHSVIYIILAASLTFIAGGFSETSAALQLASLFLGIVACFIGSANSFKRKVLPLLAAGFAGAILAAFVLILAPGNEARIASSVSQAIAQAPRTWMSFLKLSLHFGFDSVLISILTSWFTTATAALVLCAVVAFKLHSQAVDPSVHTTSGVRKPIKWLLLSPLTAFILIMFCFMPTAYVSAYMRGGYHPQPRLFVISQFVFFCFTCFWGYLAGAALKQAQLVRNAKRWLYPFAAFVAALMLVVPLNGLRRTLALYPSVRTFASMWDAQDREIQAARLQGFRRLTVRALPATDHGPRGNFHFGLRLIDSNPENWVNGCAAEYYGVDSIIAK